jgi:ribonuclease T1
VAVLAVLAAALLWWTQGSPGVPTEGRASDRPSAQGSASHDFTSTATPTTEPSGAGTDPVSGLPVIRPAQLPAEALDVLERIDAGGPFEFPEHDGGVFENREGLLPDRPRGHYREYTVDDGVGDRGPMRIVGGADGERYWTDDHYRSFARVAVAR